MLPAWSYMYWHLVFLAGFVLKIIVEKDKLAFGLDEIAAYLLQLSKCDLQKLHQVSKAKWYEALLRADVY